MKATVSWLMQSRLPDYEVVNLSLNSYSTVHALLQLQQVVPQVGPDDIVILEYHPATNALNVANHDLPSKVPQWLRDATRRYRAAARHEGSLWQD